MHIRIAETGFTAKDIARENNHQVLSNSNKNFDDNLLQGVQQGQKAKMLHKCMSTKSLRSPALKNGFYKTAMDRRCCWQTLLFKVNFTNSLVFSTREKLRCLSYGFTSYLQLIQGAIEMPNPNALSKVPLQNSSHEATEDIIPLSFLHESSHDAI